MVIMMIVAIQKIPGNFNHLNKQRARISVIFSQDLRMIASMLLDMT